MALCPSCTRAATGTPDRDLVRLGDILPVTVAALRASGVVRASGASGASGASVPSSRAGSQMTCRYCGGQARWHRTTEDRWVAIEPGARSAGGVPRGERWYLAGDGTAVILRGAAPSDTCRVSHFYVCAWRRGSRPPTALRE
jgi:hypothetical protein